MMGTLGELELIRELHDTIKADHAQLVALVKALPYWNTGDVVVEQSREGQWQVWWDDPGFHNLCGQFLHERHARAYAALLTARKEMGG